MLYLLHATVPVGTTGRNSASHYLGWTTRNGLPSRLKLHRQGKGACLTRAFVRAGAKLLLTLQVVDGSKRDERRLKVAGHLSQWCPLCNPLLAVAGAPVTLAQLRLARTWSVARSARRRSATGGVLSASSLIKAPGTFRPALPPESITSYAHGPAASEATPSGGASSATARLRRAGSTWPAGTSTPFG